jgi:hypothetical protein
MPFALWIARGVQGEAVCLLRCRRTFTLSRLAEATLAARSVDMAGAAAILAEPVRFVSE